MTKIAVIIGSAYQQSELSVSPSSRLRTPYGETTSGLLEFEMGGQRVIGFARHGEQQNYPPHAVNYQANIWALRDLGVRFCIAQNIVGGIDPVLAPGRLAVPHQLIDYTWGRPSSFGVSGKVNHVEFTEPFAAIVRRALLDSLVLCGKERLEGVYGVTQGPRLETAAEIDRYERDGCSMVGMTAMPEAVLAREAGLKYAVLAGVVNYAAGRSADSQPLHQQMRDTVDQVMRDSHSVLEKAIAALATTEL